MDFTLRRFEILLKALRNSGYSFQPFKEFLKRPLERAIILRHDVDRSPLNSLQTAIIEYKLGITGTYYFRISKCSYNEAVIKNINGLGHEIGYHYEDLSQKSGTGLFNRLRNHKKPDHIVVEEAFDAFCEHLRLFRNNLPIETICMHGTPLSTTDNRLLWKYYNYRELGIIGEPYFDLNFGNLLYLTDTGRRWNGENVSVRDTILNKIASSSTSDRKNGLESDIWQSNPVMGSAVNLTKEAKEFHKKHNYRRTKDILNAISVNRLPDRIMLTVHPQRWNNKFYPWIEELVAQNLKNYIKYFIVKIYSPGR